MTPQWGSLVRSRDKLNTLYLHFKKSMDMDTKLGKVLTYRDRFLLLNPQGPLITWQFEKFMSPLSQDLFATELGRVLTSGRCFSEETLKSSPTSCLVCCFLAWKGSQCFVFRIFTISFVDIVFNQLLTVFFKNILPASFVHYMVSNNL